MMGNSPRRRFPDDHPQRLVLANEVHARPPEPVGSPSRATCLAVLSEPEARTLEVRHLAALCQRHGLDGPGPSASHFRTTLGATRLTWERHGEFSTYAFVAITDNASPKAEGAAIGMPVDKPFEVTASDALPGDWLKAIPGVTMAVVHVDITRADAVPSAAALRERFGNTTLVGSRIASGDATLYTDFRLDELQGGTRFWVVNHALSDAQTGRFLQRLFELEVYRVLALLALPIARKQGPRIATIESSLARLTDAMARADADDEALLRELTQLAAEIESGIAASQFRRRIAELGEARIQGLQTVEEFMGRRLTPAVATCANVAQRLRGLAERIGQASAMLATRVGIEREHQNQALLASMDRRAKLQLRLQQTVEGLSVAAITYYVVGLVGYIAKGLEALGAREGTASVVTAVAVPVVALTAIALLRRTRRRLTQDTRSADAASKF
jgi:uncharacterized membrane-anchored protein